MSDWGEAQVIRRTIFQQQSKSNLETGGGAEDG
jgi:hypothetical protein